MRAACWSASLVQSVATDKGDPMGAESMALGSLITAGSGLIGVVLAKCRCVYRRQDGECQPACGFSDKPLERENNSLEIHHDRIEDCEIIIVSKKTE